jgi:hypothetical protein
MKLSHLLRYNSRHSLWFPRGAEYGEGRLVVLDPIGSTSHNKAGKRTWRLSEPLWLFRLRQRLFCFGGRQRCGRRGDIDQLVTSKAFGGDSPLPDTWDVGPDGNRTCSYCGSLHPGDLMSICRKALTDERYAVEGTTKSYKVYVKQPGVRNASEGAIKFYLHHAPSVPTQEERELFSSALRLSAERFEAQMARFRPKGVVA